MIKGMDTLVVSFVISGDGATKKELRAVEKKVLQLGKSYNNIIEAVLYFSSKPTYTSQARLLVTTSSKTIPPIRKAIVVSSGDKLIFTTIKNFLVDKENEVVKQILSIKVSNFAAPLVPFYLGTIHIRGARNAPYFVCKRDIVAGIASHSSSLRELFKLAVRSNKLEVIESVDVLFPNHVRGLPRLWPFEENKSLKPQIPKKQKEVKFSNRIPVFIICRDRLEPLKRLVDWCEKENLKNIILIDNSSTYPPLIDFFQSTSHEVIRLNHNVGYLSPWLTYAVEIYAKDKPYIISDSDIIPLSESHGAVKLFCHLLNSYPKYMKAGFGLKIDDIPDEYGPKDYVVAWEKKFWQKEIEKDVYEADIDTTFALCRAGTPHLYGPSLRTGGKFIARHETWYIDSKSPGEEVRYYRGHADKIISTWGPESTELPKIYVDQKEGKKAKSNKYKKPRSSKKGG